MSSKFTTNQRNVGMPSVRRKSTTQWSWTMLVEVYMFSTERFKNNDIMHLHLCVAFYEPLSKKRCSKSTTSFYNSVLLVWLFFSVVNKVPHKDKKSHCEMNDQIICCTLTVHYMIM